MIGPGAQREWGYYSPVESTGQHGWPKWRVALVFVAVVALLTQLPTERAQADSFAGTGTNGCVTTATVLTEFSAGGYQGGSIAFHLVIENGGSLQARWEHSTGYGWSPVYFSAGTSGEGEWWPTGTPGVGSYYGALAFTIAPGSVGNMRFVIQKAADYGGCYTVDNVQVVRYPILNTTPIAPASGNVSSPDPSYAPASAPPVGPWDETKCTGNAVSTCAEPPAGWCWAGESVYTGSGVTLVECEGAPSPAPTPTPMGGVNGQAACGNLPYVAHIVGPWTVSAGGDWLYRTLRPGGVVSGGPIQNGDAGVVRNPDSGSWSVCVFGTRTAGTGYDATHYAYPDGVVHPGVGIGPYEFHHELAPNETWQHGVQAYQASVTISDYYVWTDVLPGEFAPGFEGAPDPGPTPSYDPYPMPSGWPSYPPLPTFGAMPSFGWPSYPPFSWPSYPPFPSGGLADICAPASPGGPSPAIAACAGVSDGLSGGYGVTDPSAALSQWQQLTENLSEKAPFGYAAQAVTAITDATSSAAGGDLNDCVALDWWHPGGTSTAQWCIPWDQVSTWAAPIRFVLLAVLLIGVAVAFIGLARSTAEGAN